MKYLNGKELAEYVKERQAKEVRRLKAIKIQPKLAIISEGKNEINDIYLEIKQNYGRDIGVEVELRKTKDPLDSKKVLLELNEDENVDGIIVQLPLTEPELTDEVVNLIEPGKDVDGLGEEAACESATATAIMWLLAGYNVELRGKQVVVVGQGKLVGRPVAAMLASAGVQPETLDKNSPEVHGKIAQADVLITATGSAGLIKSSMVKPNAVVIDAGTASEAGQVKGDVSDKVYEREDITITPKKGGLGPLTVSALFDNVLRAARAKVIP